ncbi:hypothetical protein ABZT17_33790 [Streptomyces sp. NPDC005648]|uniref:hypothetical protein n=1 Tax=Streptomyces sp. NPDC005648 TaxID=3157044 RepID=UPI0033A2821E
MGTTLTPEFWGRFAVLLVAAMAVTFVLVTLFDALLVRLTHHRGHRPPMPPPRAPMGPNVPHGGRTTHRAHGAPVTR